jgi:diguanylate cyclase (GGDEF)-like protein
MHTVDYIFSLQSKVRRASTSVERAFALGDLAFTEMRMGKIDDAEQKLAEIALLSKNPSNAEIVSLHFYLLGVFDFYFGRTTKSVSHLLSARRFARLANSPRMEARSLAALCTSLSTLGAHSDAFDAGDEALEIGESAGDDRALAIARISMANLHSDRDDVEAALAQIEAAAPVLARLKDPFTSSSCEASRTALSIANVRRLMVEPNEKNRQAALEVLKLCEDVARAADASQHTKARVYSWCNLARIHQLLGDSERALVTVDHAISLCEDAGTKDNLADAHLARATYLIDLGRFEDAAAMLETARENAQGAEYLSLEEDIEATRVICFEKMGDIAAALEAAKAQAALLVKQREIERTNLDLLRKAKREFAEAQREASEARMQAAEMGKMQAQLIEDTQKFKQISFEDALTGLKNRRFFDYRFPELIEHHAQEKSSLSMAIIDIDAFKSINDRFGHVIGDAVLQAVASTLLTHKRTGDEVCRLGGDEFVLFLPKTQLGEASVICEALRQKFSAGMVGREYGVSLSIGVAQWMSSEDHTAFLTRADQKLFVAKREGRNRIAA